MSDFTPFLRFVNWASAVVGTGIALPLAYRAGLRVYDDLYERRRRKQHDKLTLQRIRDQNQLNDEKVVYPDEHGRWPLIRNRSGDWIEVNTMRQFTIQTVRQTWPGLERLDWMVRMMLAMQGVNSTAARQVPQFAETAQAPTSWPREITLDEMLRGRRPSIDDLVIGARPGENGGLEVVSRSLHELMHVLAVGTTGWGKSSWLRAMVYQMASAREPVEVVAIDASGSALNALHGWGKLRYPVARQAGEAVAILEQVTQEIDRRMSWYEQHPTVENLREYNRATGADLPPWVVIADESTHLLHQQGIGSPLREVVQRARQYGIYLLLAGQTAKASVIDTEIRDQFSSRVCFHTSPTSSRVVLDDSAASGIRDLGRAWVQLPRTELIELQGPWIEKQDMMRALSNGGPRYEMPAARQVEAALGKLAHNEVAEMVAAGESPSGIAYAAFGYSNGDTVRRVQEWIARQNDDDEGRNLSVRV